MKTYVKPELKVENLFSAATIANDPFDFSGAAGGDEGVVSALDWWEMIG